MSNLAEKNVINFDQSKIQLKMDHEFEEQLQKDANKARLFVKALCLLVQIAFFGLIGCEGAAFYFVWSNFFTTDILYLCGWFIVLGAAPTYAIISAADYVSNLLKVNLMDNIDRNEKKFQNEYYEKKGV